MTQVAATIELHTAMIEAAREAWGLHLIANRTPSTELREAARQRAYELAA